MIRSRFLKSRHSAFTLLELILALALSTVVMAAIAAAISFFYSMLSRQQRNIEQDLVGRAVLSLIANDLRAALQYKAADVAGIENLVMSEVLVAGLLGGGAPSGSGGQAEAEDGGEENTDGAGDSGGGSPGSAAAPAAEEEENPAEEDNAWYRPAFIGYSNQLTIDISRLPRLDQYSSLTTGMESTSSPSDIKRVSWLVAMGSGQQSANAESLDPQSESMGGLYRREVDRAVSAYRNDPDVPEGPDQYSRLLAPEVTAVQFRYFDGEQWVSEWASESQNGFPIAVEIVISVDASRSPEGIAFAAGQQSAPMTDPQIVRQYRSVVHLPLAEIVESEE